MSDPQNKVPFPAAGEGAYLRYRTADYVELRTKYGEPKIVQRKAPESGFPMEYWETFTHRIDDGLGNLDPIVIVDCLRAGLKNEDGRTKFAGVDWNDLSFSLTESVPSIRNALVLAVTNQPYAALLAKQREANEEAERNRRLRERGVEFNDDEQADDTDPTLTLTTSTLSGASSGSDIPPAS